MEQVFVTSGVYDIEVIHMVNDRLREGTEYRRVGHIVSPDEDFYRRIAKAIQSDLRDGVELEETSFLNFLIKGGYDPTRVGPFLEDIQDRAEGVIIVANTRVIEDLTDVLSIRLFGRRRWIVNPGPDQVGHFDFKTTEYRILPPYEVG